MCAMGVYVCEIRVYGRDVYAGYSRIESLKVRSMSAPRVLPFSFFFLTEILFTVCHRLAAAATAKRPSVSYRDPRLIWIGDTWHLLPVSPIP